MMQIEGRVEWMESGHGNGANVVVDVVVVVVIDVRRRVVVVVVQSALAQIG